MSGGLDARSRAEVQRLADAGAVLRRRLSAALRRAGEQAAQRARRRILGAASHHDGTLRAEIARTVGVRAHPRRDGGAVAITSAGWRMPPGKHTLPSYANAGPGWPRWRHPVFGNDWWVTQTWPSAAGWFGRLRGEREQIAAELRRALDAVARDLGR